MNPFAPHNFSEEQLATTPGPEWTMLKNPIVPDPRVPRSMQNMNPDYVEFFPETKEVVDQLIKEARDNYQIPFDELFHRQKTVIQNVVDAELALKEKIS